MNWRKAAEDDLRQYTRRLESLENIQERIRGLEQRRLAIKSANTDATPVQGGGNRYEDAILDNIVERERLKRTYRATQVLVRLVERGLAGLDERERRVLEAFYITRQHGHVERLMEELGYEQRRIYQIKDAALYNFTLHLYGLTDY